MADFINITVSGLTELRVDLARALSRLDKPRDLMATLGAVLEANIERRFDRKVDPAGAPWAPLAIDVLAACGPASRDPLANAFRKQR